MEISVYRQPEFEEEKFGNYHQKLKLARCYSLPYGSTNKIPAHIARLPAPNHNFAGHAPVPGAPIAPASRFPSLLAA
jgi:hypothetical protein